MKNITLQSEYSKNGSYIQLCLPIETDVFIPVDDSVRLLDQVFDQLDYTALYRSYSPKGRNPAISPIVMFKILVYANSRGIYSSREIERACRLDLAFRFLLGSSKAPDHNTIARFRSERLGDCLEGLLSQLVERLHELGEVSFDHLFVDGTKIEANANRYSFVWQKATTKHEAKLQGRVRDLLAQYIPEDSLPAHFTSAFLSDIHKQLTMQAQAEGITFVSGRGRHKTQRQRDIETLGLHLDRLRVYERYHRLFRGRNSFSKTDPDATFMRMKDDHMMNGQLKAAYNVQVAVESEYIVGVDISSERSDMNTLKPLLQRLESNYDKRFKRLVADAGYESEENYEYLACQNIEAFIKPGNYEYAKTRRYAQEQSYRLKMVYNADDDTYRCMANRTLNRVSDRHIKRTSGYKSKTKVYECESCEGCGYLGSCYKGKYTKRIQVNERFNAYRAQSHANITSRLGIHLRVNRSIQAEGVFAVTKQNMGFRRFLTRGEGHVRTEYLLLALGFNINKLHHRIQNGRLGKALFLSQSAA